MSYYHQVHNFGLGNAINGFAALRRLSEKHNKPIPVYFDLDFVRDCFLDCPFIEILDTKPNSQPLFTSVLTNTTHNTRPDYQFIFEKVTGEKWSGQQCYVDRPNGYKMPSNNYAVFIHGSAHNDNRYLDTKEIPVSYYEMAVYRCIERGLDVVFVGNASDLKRNKWAEPYAIGNNDIRHALCLISNASVVIGNDSGLIHASGAMNKKTFVFWKNTQYPRCYNSGNNSYYLHKGDWSNVLELI